MRTPTEGGGWWPIESWRSIGLYLVLDFFSAAIVLRYDKCDAMLFSWAVWLGHAGRRCKWCDSASNYLYTVQDQDPRSCGVVDK